MNNQCYISKKKYRKEKIRLIIYQLILLFSFLTIWELLAYYNVINTFIFSKPSDILELLVEYIKTNEIFRHIKVSLIETILGIVLGSSIGIIIAILLWYFETLQKVLNPFLSVLNALPKTALAPIMIIWAGAGMSGIVVVAISILLIITVLSTYNYFINVDSEKIRMLESFKATKLQIFMKFIFPSNIKNIFNVIKINVGMSWVGVIVGEFLVSKEGLGYLIMYGGQVFKLDLVMMGVIVLAILAFVMSALIDLLEKKIVKGRDE
jgi:NitT/TauT family transport system permease protein